MKPWWILLPLAAMAIAQLVYNWDEVHQYGLLSFDVTKNAASNVPLPGILGHRVTSAAVRTLAASMWVSTALVLLVRWRKKQPFWALAVLALSPMLILGGADYGGEAIFRIFLYSLIGCSVVLAPGLVKMLQGGMKRYAAGFVAVLIACTLATQGYTGGWYADVMPRAQVLTANRVLATAELPAYLTAVAPVWPERTTWRYVDYARFNKDFDANVIDAHQLALKHFDTDDDYAAAVKELDTRLFASTYLIFTDQMQVYSWYYGILPWDALPNLKERIKNDPERWQPFYDGEGITVFVHKVHPAGDPAAQGDGG
jgi:hypothetical protein